MHKVLQIVLVRCMLCCGRRLNIVSLKGMKIHQLQ